MRDWTEAEYEREAERLGWTVEYLNLLKKELETYRGKVVLCGDSGVGKTALLTRYVDDRFSDEYKQTVGDNFLIKGIEVNKLIDNLEIPNLLLKKDFKFYFWDRGSQPSRDFSSEYYYVQAVGAILVYDIANRESFYNLDFWINMLLEISGNIPFIIVGNKLDLIKDRQVDFQTSIEVARYLEVPYIETSAKTNKNVASVFESLTNQILQQLSGNYSHKRIRLPQWWRMLPRKPRLNKCETCNQTAIFSYPEIDGEPQKLCLKCYSELQDMINSRYNKELQEIENMFDDS